MILGFSPVSLTQSGSAVTIAFNITLATLDLSGNVSGAVLTFTMRAWDTYSVTYHLASGSGSAVIQNDLISGKFDGDITYYTGSRTITCHATDHGFLLTRLS